MAIDTTETKHYLLSERDSRVVQHEPWRPQYAATGVGLMCGVENGWPCSIALSEIIRKHVYEPYSASVYSLLAGCTVHAELKCFERHLPGSFLVLGAFCWLPRAG